MYAAVMSISAKKADKQNKMISGGFHADGTIEVEVTLREQDVVISCTDHGVGIPPEKIPKLGEPFSQPKRKARVLAL
ncbi:ATP-binding protein [Paenibacillus larvae]|nr:ATP-binding protein [Paenibacillus larvae]MDT2260731.1 ATP-binding protein [Paenibacillus larvae]